MLGLGLNIAKAGLRIFNGFVNALSTLFDGVDEFAETSGDVPALNSLTKMTWVCWFKYASLATNQTIMAKWDFSTQGSWAFHSDSANSDELKFFVASFIGDTGSSSMTTTNANLTSGTWFNMVVVYDGDLIAVNRLKVYIDSVLKTVTIPFSDIPASLTNGSASVKIGKFGGSLNRNLNGNVDEVGLFPNVAFNQAEVTEAYNIGIPIDLATHSQSANLNNYWRMGDGDTFPTITDQQGNNDLAMTNMEAGDFVTDTP